MSRPLISVVVPAYNGEATLRRVLDSVFAQDSIGLDVVVCNDGSTDATASILCEYGSRVAVVSQNIRGRGAAARELLEQATVQHAFYSDAIGNLHALESDANPATLRVTSRRVFQ
jgi:teichuronic acid biosynthesis glycosyltransferase TuaG